MLRFTETLLGKMVIEQDGKKYTIEIREGNCLAVFVYKNEGGWNLYSFFVDSSHFRRMAKGGKVFSDDVKRIRLNLRYRQSRTLARLFTKNGYEVTCYYE